MMWTIKGPPDPWGVGNDLYREWNDPVTGVTLRLTFWDLWLVMFLVKDFGSRWDETSGYFRHSSKGSGYDRENAEGLLNHLCHLQEALSQAGLMPQDVLEGADKTFLSKQRPKARRRILDLHIPSQEKSRWMIETPRYLREQRAMRGYWGAFPVSPAGYADQLTRLFKTSGFYSEDQSFGLADKLSAFIDKREAKAGPSELFALYRAFLTVMLEQINSVDDSYGVIGDLYEEIFKGYFELDRAELAMPLPLFFQDLLELLLWEDYAFTSRSSPELFASLSPEEAEIVETILRRERQELQADELEYQSEEALTYLGLLYAEQRLFARFIPIAKEMGTRQWQRITRLAEAAESAQLPALATQVYEACLGPGFHEKYLREKYEELQDRLNS